MMRIYVCSRLRGPNGQPSQENIAIARRLMRAVFDAGHAPFVPHLLYPQVLSENADDLKVSFAANYAFLYTCEEVWVYARSFAECSSGMKLEIEDVEKSRAAMPNGQMYDRPWPKIVWMPAPFAAVEEVLALEQRDAPTVPCRNCGTPAKVGRSGLCYDCFCGVSRR